MTAAAPITPDEHQRLARLRALQVLDTAAEPVFDVLARAAAATCGVPIALLSLVDEDRQWFKANVGLEGVGETRRDVAFCAHAIQSDDPLIVEDAASDPRFADNPLVTHDPGIRFYAGAPLVLSDGVRLGTLCAIDRVPRRLEPRQIELLRQLSRAASAALELRERSQTRLHELEVAQTRLSRLYHATPAMLHSVDSRGNFLSVSDTWLATMGYSREEVIGRPAFEFLTPAAAHYLRTVLIPEFFSAGRVQNVEYQMVRKDGQVLDVSVSAVLDQDEKGRPRSLAVVQDITARKLAEKRLLRSRDRLQQILEGTNAGTWEWNVQTGAVHFNARWAEMIGYTLDELAPLSIDTWTGLVHPDDQPRSAALLERHFTGELPYYDCKVRMRHKNGHWIWVHDRGRVAVRDAEGHPRWLTGTHTDITSSQETEEALIASKRALAESRELLQVTLESIADAVITTDVDGAVMWLNPVAQRLTGWSAAEARGRSVDEVFSLVDETTRDPIENPVARCLARGEAVGATVQGTLIARDGGREYGVEDTASPIRDRDGHVLGAVLVFRDVSEQRRLNREIQLRATHDPLTGLVNRGEFEQRLARAFRYVREEGATSSLLYIDLDRFKHVNDTCGHAAGDDLLKQLAGVLHERVRRRDTLARIGGDEFAVILEHCSLAQAERVAQSIRAEIANFEFQWEGGCHQVGASIGIAPIAAEMQTEAAVLQAADMACYAAKRAGRNRVHVWSERDRAALERQAATTWASRIEQALSEDRFTLYAQRVVPLQSQAPSPHCEVLLRMNSGDDSLLLPSAFLAEANQYNFGARIDRWVVSRVCDELARLAGRQRPPAGLSVNLSAQSVADQNFLGFVRDLLEGRRFDPHLLCFEIAESTLLTHTAAARAFIGECRALGVRIAIDEFGIGGSFSYLKTLTVDSIKISGQFVRRLDSDALDLAAVRCFQEVARAKTISVVAKFVEAQPVLEMLGELGVEYGQGYLLHQPQALKDLLAADVGRSAQRAA